MAREEAGSEPLPAATRRRSARTRRVGVILLITGGALVISAILAGLLASVSRGGNPDVDAAPPLEGDLYSGDEGYSGEEEYSEDAGDPRAAFPYEPREVSDLHGAEYELYALAEALEDEPESAIYEAPVALEEISYFVDLVLDNASKMLSHEATTILRDARDELYEAAQAAAGADVFETRVNVGEAASFVSAAVDTQDAFDAIETPNEEPTTVPEDEQPIPISISDYVSMAGAAGGLLAAAGTVITATSSLTNARRRNRQAQESQTGGGETSDAPSELATENLFESNDSGRTNP